MEEKDIIDGEIYVFNDTFLNKMIVSNAKNHLNVLCYIDISCNSYVKSKASNSDFHTAREATPEEKHWLNKCIKLDNFISKEEALKDFNKPEPENIVDDLEPLMKLLNNIKDV